MSLTVNVVKRYKDRNGEVVIAEITPDSGWLAAGEVLTPADLGAKTIDYASPALAGGYVFTYDYTNSKLLAFYGNYDAADGPLIAVPDATDISAAVPRMKFECDHVSAIES